MADEVKVYQPLDSLVAKAHIKGLPEYKRLYEQSLNDPDTFWSDVASEYYWNKKWTNPVCSYNFHLTKGPVFAKWFDSGETNIAYNCLDRHVKAGHGGRVAFYWEGNDVGQEAVVTYQQLLDTTCQIANYLKSIGIKKGDDVTIYMPMVAELPATMLACARIGAVHSVVFAGFSAESLAGRILDSKPRVVVTASGAMRGPKPIPIKRIVDDAIELVTQEGHYVDTVLVFDHKLAVAKADVRMVDGRDVWWQDAVATQPTECPVEWVGAEDPLFKLYTSGSTGKPKGMLHTTGGYMVGVGTTVKYVFDCHMDDVYWCTADCGWITGHSYLTYGPLLQCATQVVFEGVPTYPDAGRCWEVVDKYKVTIFYTAPTAIRALHAKGDSFVLRHSRASLRLLGSVGEPINPEAWRWYHEVVGGGRCAIMDTWWQTETGAHMITPLPGVTPLKPGSATLPFFGVAPTIVVVDERGAVKHVGDDPSHRHDHDHEPHHLTAAPAVEAEAGKDVEGLLMVTRPWPSMARTVAGDHARYEATYFSCVDGMYFTGDGCRRDADGYYWIIGRVDDVINVSGHRIGTAEVESALVGHPQCAEAAVVPVEHPIKGQAIYAFVTLMEGNSYPAPESLRQALVAQVRKAIGAIATPDVIHWAPGLPKTRSGKIMRRILRKIAAKEEDSLGDITTLADPAVVPTLIELRGK